MYYAFIKSKYLNDFLDKWSAYAHVKNFQKPIHRIPKDFWLEIKNQASSKEDIGLTIQYDAQEFCLSSNITYFCNAKQIKVKSFFNEYYDFN